MPKCGVDERRYGRHHQKLLLCTVSHQDQPDHTSDKPIAPVNTLTHRHTHTHPSSWNSTTSCSLLLGQLWGGFYGLWCVHSRVSSLPVSSFLGEMLVDYWRGESWQWITYITPSYPPLVLPQTGLFCSRTSLLQIAHFPSVPRWLYFSRRNEVVEYELRIELACF